MLILTREAVEKLLGQLEGGDKAFLQTAFRAAGLLPVPRQTELCGSKSLPRSLRTRTWQSLPAVTDTVAVEWVDRSLLVHSHVGRVETAPLTADAARAVEDAACE
jgi:hypothetical protein